MNYVLVVDDSAVDRQVIGHAVSFQTGLAVKYAANGLEALEELEAMLPLAVVTDLYMPEMDGMQLVEQIRKRYSTVPVILVTQQGTEDITLRALIHGAADFVPKVKIATRIGEVIHNVTALASGDVSHDRLLPLLDYLEARYTLDNDLDLVASAANQLRQMAANFGLVDQADGVRLAKALYEALKNAIYHGNLNLDQPSHSGAALATAIVNRRLQSPYGERRVHVTAVCTRTEARYVIRDEGTGFAIQGPTATAQISEGSAHGLVLIRAFMDEVSFNVTGNEITLVKRKPRT